MKHQPAQDIEARVAKCPLLPALQVDVFVEFPQTHQIIRRAQRNDAFSRMHWKFREGGPLKAIEHYKSERSPDLLIIESDEGEANVLKMLEALSRECRENTRVIFIGGGADQEVELYRKILKIGVNDFLPAPVETAQVIGSILDVFEDVSEIKLGRVSAFIGAGGGTGSSSLAQNCATAMAHLMGTEVLLADLDPQYGTVALNFNVTDAYTITDVLRRRSPIDDVLIERILTPVNERLKLLLVEPSVDNLPNLPVHAISAVLQLAQTTPRHVLLDMTHVWGPRTKKTLCRADKVIVTTMPTLTGLRNARNLIEVLHRIRPANEPPVVVLNKTNMPKRMEISAAVFKQALGLENVLEIPYDSKAFSTAQAQGKGVVHIDETGRSARQIIHLARVLNRDLDKGDPRSSGERLLARLRKWW